MDKPIRLGHRPALTDAVLVTLPWQITGHGSEPTGSTFLDLSPRKKIPVGLEAMPGQDDSGGIKMKNLTRCIPASVQTPIVRMGWPKIPARESSSYPVPIRGCLFLPSKSGSVIGTQPQRLVPRSIHWDKKSLKMRQAAVIHCPIYPPFAKNFPQRVSCSQTGQALIHW